jgi:hypothetical protein
MPGIKKRTTPGALDDDAVKRAKDAQTKKQKQLDALDAKAPMNPYDAAGKALAEAEGGESKEIRRIFDA